MQINGKGTGALVSWTIKTYHRYIMKRVEKQVSLFPKEFSRFLILQ